MRVNASRRRLLRLWRQLDNACSELYNAMDEHSDNARVLSEIPKDVRDKLERIDVTQIVAVKEQVEIMLDKMRDKKYNRDKSKRS